MTQYVRHFLEHSIGNGKVPGVSMAYACPGVSINDTWVSASILSTKYLGDRFFFLNTQNMLTANTRAAIGLDNVNADAARADFEVLTRIHTGFGQTPNIVSIGGRCSGTGAVGGWSGYFGEVRRSSSIVAIVKGVAGTDTDLATAAMSIGANDTYFMRFQARGTNLKLRVWKGELADEPVAWTVTVTDATYAAAGTVNLGCKNSAGVNGLITTFFITTGTGTDSAPAGPKTWQDYLDFLNQGDTFKCFLAEVDPLGQDASGNPITARVCAANMAYVSRPEDFYPNTCYEELMVQAPRVKRRMNDVLRGRSTMSSGDMVWENEVSNDDGSGRLDAWFSWNWDGRPLRVLLGHPTWRRCDFKTVFSGAIQNIYKAGYGRLGFKIRGPEAILQQPVSTALIGGSGPNANALAPVAFSMFFNAEPLLYDAATLTYQVFSPFPPNTGMARFSTASDHDVRAGGVSQKQATRTILSVNAGTDTITTDAAHGMLVGGAAVFPIGPLPAPLVVNTKYYVKTVPSGSTFTLSATSGGATIDITTTTAGGTLIGRNYDWDDATGRIQLLVDPGNSRVTVDFLNPFNSVTTIVGGLMGAANLPGDAYHGQGVFQTVGKWRKEQWSVGDAIDEVTTSVGASWNFSREGSWYLYVLDVPGATVTWTANSDDFRNWRTGERYLPAFVERLGYQTNYTVESGADLAGSVSVANRDLFGKAYSLTTYTPSEVGLEQPANHILADQLPERPTLLMLVGEAQTEQQRLYTLRRKARGTWLFDAEAWAFAAELGDVVNVTYARDGFANGKKAVIVGITDDYSKCSAEVEIFAQIDGQWPVVSAAQPFASEVYY